MNVSLSKVIWSAVHVVCIWGSPNLDVFHPNEIFDLLSHHSYNSNIGEFVMILLKNYLYLYIAS